MDLELLTPKKIVTKTISGKNTIPNSNESAGVCNVETVSGNITITIKE